MEYDLAIYYGEGSTPKDFLASMIDDGNIWPHLSPKNIVVIYDNNVLPKEETKWHELIQVQVFNPGSILEAFNHAVKLMKSRYCLFVIAGHQLDWLWLSKLSDVVDKERVILVEPDDEGNRLFVLRELYNDVGGTSQTSVINKIKTLASEQGVSHYLYSHDLTQLKCANTGGTHGTTEGTDFVS